MEAARRSPSVAGVDMALRTAVGATALGRPLFRRASATLLARGLSAQPSYHFDTLFEENHLGLPRLPIPELDATLDRYLRTLQPHGSASELAHSAKAIEAFRTGPGPQVDADLKAWDQANAERGGFPYFFFEEQWDEAYLGARCPTTINLNPVFTLAFSPQPGSQTTRAAQFLSASARWLAHARAGALAADGLDMSRLGRVMGTARIPHETLDTLEFYGAESRHVIVQSGGGHFHSIDILAANGTARAVEDIEASLSAVLAESARSSQAEPGVGVLTALPRAEWAAARKQLLASDATGTNAASLREIDSALLMVSLDADDLSDQADFCRAALHGHNAATRSDRWWDKIQICFDTNGRASLQFEHSFSDGLSWNRWLGEVWHAMGLMETPAKWPYGDLQAASAATGAATAPRKLDFKLDDASKTSIAKADVHLEQCLGRNVDLHPAVFEGFGKNAIKKMGHSPDAFVQMAYQLAYARQHDGKSAPTYEACSTAGAFHGRTETIRSCSPESAALVAGCLNGTASLEMLSQATAAQSALSRSAAFGEGIDRHLLGLSKFAKMNGSDEALGLFADPLHSRTGTWVLSTSNVGSPWLEWFAFGPQCDPGFGLGYSILDNGVSIAVSSNKSSSESVSSAAMFGAISEALVELQALCD